MDRELLIEIGVEEVPASWLPSLTTQLADVAAAQLRAARLDVDGPVESWTTPRRLTVRVARVAERQTDLEEVVSGPPVSAARGADGRADAGGHRLCEEERRRARRRSRRSRRRRAGISRCGSGSAGSASVDALPDVMTGLLRGLAFPKTMRWDAWLDDGKGELPLRPAGPLAAVPLRRPRRPVRHPSHRRRAVAAGAGRAIGRDDLRPPVPHDQRARRPRREGEDLRRLQGAPARALRRPRARGSARADRARPRRPRRPTGRPRASRGGRAGRAARRSAGSGRVAGGRRRHLPGRVPGAAGRSADDDDDPSPALLPGGGRSRQVEAGVSGRHQHRGRAAGADQPQLRAGAHGAAARRAVLLERRSQGAARGAHRAAGHDPVPQETGQLQGEGRARRDAWREWVATRGAWAAGRRRGTPRRRDAWRRRISPPTWCASSPSCRAPWAASTPARRASPRRCGRRSTTTTCRWRSKPDAPPTRAQLGAGGRDVGGGVDRRQARHAGRAVRGRRAPDRLARSVRAAATGARAVPRARRSAGADGAVGAADGRRARSAARRTRPRRSTRRRVRR